MSKKSDSCSATTAASCNKGAGCQWNQKTQTCSVAGTAPATPDRCAKFLREAVCNGFKDDLGGCEWNKKKGACQTAGTDKSPKKQQQ